MRALIILTLAVLFFVFVIKQNKNVETVDRGTSKYNIGDKAYFKVDSSTCIITSVQYNSIGNYYQYSIQYKDNDGVLRTNDYAMIPEYNFY